MNARKQIKHMKNLPFKLYEYRRISYTFQGVQVSFKIIRNYCDSLLTNLDYTKSYLLIVEWYFNKVIFDYLGMY